MARSSWSPAPGVGLGTGSARPVYEMHLQMRGRAGERQRKDLPRIGLTHSLGAFPHRSLCAIRSSVTTARKPADRNGPAVQITAGRIRWPLL